MAIFLFFIYILNCIVVKNHVLAPKSALIFLFSSCLSPPEAPFQLGWIPLVMIDLLISGLWLAWMGVFLSVHKGPANIPVPYLAASSQVVEDNVSCSQS